MNELSMIFARLGLDTEELLKAAVTKWNFHHYHPIKGNRDAAENTGTYYQ